MNALFERGAEHFNKGEFFEAHDSWEELWVDTRGEDRLFYQGLIQAAVGLYHFSHGNFRGAESQLGKAVEKLNRYPLYHHGIETGTLAEALRAWKASAAQGASGRMPDALPERPRIRSV